MGTSPVEHRDSIQAFHGWKQSPETRKKSLEKPGKNCADTFVPRSALEGFLTLERIKKLLDDVIRRDDERAEVSQQYVLDHYLRPFAILLSANYGHFILHFVQHASLKDDRLPFQTKPRDFPISEPDFFQLFQSHQWQFCAPTLEHDMKDEFDDQEILPIVEKEKIGEGGSAVVYRIAVEKEYNHLLPSNKRNFQNHANNFVLKTYHETPEAEQSWKDERKAFLKLRACPSPSPNIVTYYGAFRQGNSYNLILEYADQGTLKEYMFWTPPPSTVEDTTLFWKSFFQIMHGLVTIHNTWDDAVDYKNTTSRSILGSHQDLKLDNILVFRKPGSSRYDCDFKIADLGLVHFKRNDSLPNELSQLERFGTKEYGAPETFRQGEMTKAPNLMVSQNVDIWSMGCILSEICVWANSGWEMREEYRRRREEEVHRSGGGRGIYSFHHNGELLSTVKETHKTILKRCRVKDRVTQDVIVQLLEDMIQIQMHGRPDANQVYIKCERFVKKAEEDLGIDLTQAAGNVEGDGQNYQKRKAKWTPPGLPPEDDPRASRFDQTTERRSVSSPYPQSGSLPTDTDSYATQPPRGPLSPSSHFTRQPPERILTVQRAIETDQDEPHFAYGSLEARPIASSPATIPSATQSVTSGLHSVQSKPPVLASAQFSGTFPERPGLHQPPPDVREGPDHNIIPSHNPVLTIEQGLDWKKRVKDSKKKRWGEPEPKLDGAENHFTQLGRRDHVFIFDNSQSMEFHKESVKRLVGLLAYMLKKTDPNGLDMCLTQSPQAKNSSKSTELVEVVEQATFQGTTDMRISLSRCLREFQASSSKRITSGKNRFGLKSTEETDRPLSFYILTDGKWNSSEVDGVILTLVSAMEKESLQKERVGIQFIRFGNDEDGTQRMDRLDNGLGLKDRNMDLVDTTYWNDNVWKQLLGAISDHYDEA